MGRMISNKKEINDITITQWHIKNKSNLEKELHEINVKITESEILKQESKTIYRDYYNNVFKEVERKRKEYKWKAQKSATSLKNINKRKKYLTEILKKL